jgi:hypothetical protein
MRFEFRDVPCHHGGRQVHLGGRTGKTPVVGHFDENAHRLQTVHVVSNRDVPRRSGKNEYGRTG